MGAIKSAEHEQAVLKSALEVPDLRVVTRNVKHYANTGSAYSIRFQDQHDFIKGFVLLNPKPSHFQHAFGVQ